MHLTKIFYKNFKLRVLVVAQWLINPTSTHEDAGYNPPPDTPNPGGWGPEEISDGKRALGTKSVQGLGLN